MLPLMLLVLLLGVPVSWLAAHHPASTTAGALGSLQHCCRCLQQQHLLLLQAQTPGLAAPLNLRQHVTSRKVLLLRRRRRWATPAS
jgi:hypothetical protein